MAHGYDWPVIRRLYESGRSAYALAMLPGHPSKQAILKRIRREGWEQSVTTPVSEGSAPVTAESGPFPERHMRALRELSNGATFTLAAAVAGVSRQTLQDWRDTNPTYAEACRTAKAAHRLKLLGHIDSAAERDWKAAAWRLERDEDTKEDFAPPSARSQGFGGLTIVLGIDRTKTTVSEDGRTLTIDQPAEIARIQAQHIEGTK